MSKEFDYFGEPHISKLVDLILQLGSELHVTQQRVRVLQMQLERQGVLEPGAVDYFIPDAQEQVALDRAREELLARLLRIMTERGPAEHPLREEWELRLEQRR